MSRSNREVGGYRGRRTATDILKLIAIILGVLVVLAVAGVIYLQRYLVYTAEGAKLELPPFLQILRQGGEKNPGGSASIPDPGSLSIDIQPPDGSQPEPGVTEPEPEAPGYGVELALDEVLNGTAAARLEEAGAGALILEVKDQEGNLAWVSEVAEAVKSKVNGTQAAADALRQWNSGDVYTIARVCCFRDNTTAYHCNSLALKQSNGTWRDELGLRWLSPALAQDYIAQLCGELGALGFDEIVLEQFAFPTQTQGKVERILRGNAYNASQLNAGMESFLTKVQQAVAPYGTKISLRVERDTLAGTESLSGLTPQMLEQFACRLWVEEDGQLSLLTGLLEQAGITGGEERLALISPVRRENSPVFQAILNEAPEDSGT